MGEVFSAQKLRRGRSGLAGIEDLDPFCPLDRMDRISEPAERKIAAQVFTEAFAFVMPRHAVDRRIAKVTVNQDHTVALLRE